VICADANYPSALIAWSELSGERLRTWSTFGSDLVA